MLTGLAATGLLHAHGAAPRKASGDSLSKPMVILVNDDRMTISFAGAPQIYLYGVIDAGAPQRFEALVKSGKIPQGSDIYLNSAKGEPAAGMALGRMFRSGGMTTHLGTPRKGRRSGYRGSKAAVCTGACFYAYLGGLFRWAPTGGDRIGLERHASTATLPGSRSTKERVDEYLKSMDIDLGWLGPAPTASADAPQWLTADQMLQHALANNGRLPLRTKTWLLPPEPSLQLDQRDRYGDHRLVLKCRPGNITLTAYDLVGATRAGQIVANETRSYFEINREEVLAEPRGSARVVDGAVMISRPYPPTELVHLLSSRSIGAWVGGRTSAFRYGFSFVLYPARDAINEFYNACWRAAPWPARKTAEKR